MASVVITCPECKKKFKGKAELQGKKIRCPFCKEAFVVAEEFAEAEAVTIPPSGAKAKSAAKPTSKAAAAPPPQSAPAAKADNEDEDSANPYGITKLDLAPRCPNCANEMESEEAVVCLYCGYHTLTRTWGKTKKVFALTFRDYLLYLLPGVLAATGVLLMIAAVVYYCLVLPDTPKWGWVEFFTDHESTRLWMASFALFVVWGLGMYVFNRLVLNPRPPDKVKQEKA